MYVMIGRVGFPVPGRIGHPADGLDSVLMLRSIAGGLGSTSSTCIDLAGHWCIDCTE